MSTTSSRPLTSRPLDLVYFIFFATHIPATLLIDLQSLPFVRGAFPRFLQALPEKYVAMSADPLISSVLNASSGTPNHFLWFQSFVCLELFFQLPVFFIGVYGLWKDSRSIYVLLMLYGASTATTLIPCLSIILSTPSRNSVNDAGILTVTDSQRMLLLSSYVPYLVVPLMMAIDMALRVQKLMRLGSQAESQAKNR